MQYFRPADPYYVGDCMPFFHEGIYHLYYLQDENHHQAKGGLGGHQWAHATTRDLVSWEHHPIAIPCAEDWEGSICTGSVFFHGGVYYGFYATRMPDRNERLSLATSTDGIHFEKTLPNPFAGPLEGYRQKDYRDPFVFADEEKNGLFHMLVTARLDDYPLFRRGGCLVHLTSTDLHEWSIAEPFIVPGGEPGYPSLPECPDYFRWNDWYYLIFSLDTEARYRMSRNPMGPWECPAVDTFDGKSLAAVMKTASFTGDRRIGVAFLAGRKEDKDDGQRTYAGHALFRELVQHADGTLGTKFPIEMIPETGAALELARSGLTNGALVLDDSFHIAAPYGLEAAMIEGLPHNVRITLRVEPKPNSADFGLCFRGGGALESGYYLHFLPHERRVTLNQQAIFVEGLDRPFNLDIVLRDDIIDVCIDARRCLVDRSGERTGSKLFLFGQNADVKFDNVTIRPLL